MSRVPILVRLTAAYGVAMVLMLTAAALFVGLRLRADLDDRIDASLRHRSAAALDAYDNGTRLGVLARALEDREEVFLQLMDRTGRVIRTGGELEVPAITPEEAAVAEAGGPTIDRRLRGMDGAVRILVTPVELRSARPGVMVVGQSLVDRQDALSSVVTSFVLGGVATLFVASATGYGLARAGLAPVEGMRRKAREISLSGSPGLLPLPRARDEIRRLGETLNDMLQRLREAFDRERRFVADASHEIRTPLATVTLDIDAALGAESLSPDVHAALLSARAECLRLARLADDLLVLARLDDGRIPLRMTTVDVAEMLRRTRDSYAGSGTVDGRFVEVEAPPSLTIMADPDRVRQVVTNLADNALRHGAGTVTLAASRHGEGIEIAVTDQGSGFPEGFADRAFDRFSRADAARGGDGAGLGLALVWTIAAAHGGVARIDPGPPPAVRVWVPARTQEAVAPGRVGGSHAGLIQGS